MLIAVWLSSMFTALAAPSEALVPLTLVVNSTVDAVDVNPGDGICLTERSECTLRAAIMEANASPGGDSITLPVGTYTLSLAGQDEDAALTGDLDISDDLSIQGADIATTIVDGGGVDRVFHITGVFAVTFSDLTIQNGLLTSGQGGGILNSGGVLNLSRAALITNTADTGGGLFNTSAANATLFNSILFGNTSESVGGGIGNDTDSRLDMVSSLLYGNIASDGGGIYNASSVLNISNSTLSNNKAIQGDGGAVYATASQPITILFSTLVANQAQNRGGAIAVGSTGDVFNLGATLFAQNTAITTVSHTCGSLSLRSEGYNIADDLSCQGVLTAVGDQNQVDPLIGNLGNYGGFTPTYNLLVGSPAIDAVTSATFCSVTEDQRGVARPQNSYCDTGSFEAVPLPTLNAPDGLALSNILRDSMTLNWVDQSTDEDAFAIERSSDGIHWQEVDRTAANVTTFIDMNLVCSTSYSYRVRAYRTLDGSYSAYSAPVTAATPTCLTDLALLMNSSIATVPQGDMVDYTLMVTAEGADPAPDVEVKDILPGGMIYVSAQASQGHYDAGSGLWAVGQIPANNSVTLVIRARTGISTYGQTLLNTAEITSAAIIDPDSTPNNHDPLEDDWAESRIMVDCASASVFDVADGDVTGLIIALEAANNAACYPDTDTINLAPNGHYLLNAVYAQQTGLPVITNNLVMNGHDATIERDASVNTPHFRLLTVAATASVSLDSITLQSGNPRINTDTHDYTQHGGAILNEGTLTITKAKFIKNVSVEGGAIANHNGTLSVTDSTFTLNDALGSGGGIVNDGDMASATVSKSTFDRNTAGQAGALANFYGQMTITNSTFSRNSSGNLVDAIETDYGTLSLTHTTIFNDAPGTHVTLYFVSSAVQLRANIIQTAQTTICDGTGNPPVSLGYNLTNGNSLCGTLALSDKINTNPQLGNLEFNGGATQTINLLGSSPALDAIPSAGCTLAFDQRGVFRPQFNGCDSGAFETDGFTQLVPVLVSPVNNTAISTNPPTFSWQPIILAHHYELQFGTANPPSAPVIIVNSTSYTPDSPLLETPYYWRVRAITPSGKPSPWSVVWTFNILSASNAAPVINVVNTAQAVLTWSPVTWAAGYEIQIDIDADFALPHVDQREFGAGATFYTTPPLLNGTYYWRIRAKKTNGNWGNWSAVQPLNIALP